MGSHISKVKSLTLDTWSREQVDVRLPLTPRDPSQRLTFGTQHMKARGNSYSNSLLNPDEYRNPCVLTNFVRAPYSRYYPTVLQPLSMNRNVTRNSKSSFGASTRRAPSPLPPARPSAPQPPPAPRPLLPHLAPIHPNPLLPLAPPPLPTLPPNPSSTFASARPPHQSPISLRRFLALELQRKGFLGLAARRRTDLERTWERR